MYIQICLHTHTYIYVCITKKWWQSGSTEKDSVEALSAWLPLSRAVVAELAGLCSPNICINIYIYIHTDICKCISTEKKVVAKWLNREILSGSTFCPLIIALCK